MSLENTDSTSERIDHLSNQFSNESKSLPPLISNSPPPFSEEQETSSVEEDGLNSNSVGNFQKPSDSDELNLSSDNLPESKTILLSENDLASQNTQVNKVQIETAALQSLDKEWDAFDTNKKVDNPIEPDTFDSAKPNTFDPFQNNQENLFSNNSDEIAFENSEDTSNWADFGHVEPSFDNQNTNNNNNDFFNSDSLEIASSDDLANKICSEDVSEENTNKNKNILNEKNEEDEWGNFVELESVKIPENADTLSKKLPNANIQDKLVENEFFTNLESFLENMFNNYQTTCMNESGAEINCNEPFIDSNQTWQQIKMLTSNIEESNSLQFKWNLSTLEDNYLNSLELKRIMPQVRREKFYNTILQPVKIDPPKPSSCLIPTPSQTETAQITPKTQPPSDKYTDFDSLKLTLPEQSTPIPAARADEIDLSYFETVEKTPYNPSITPNVTKTKLTLENGSSLNLKDNVITGIASPKAISNEASSKIYLDSLLADIFKNNSKSATTNVLNSSPSTNSLKKDEDFLTNPDKKSLSSSTSSSMSNLSELSLHLQPQNLKTDMLQEFMHSKHTYDTKADKILAMLPPAAVDRKSNILVYPLSYKMKTK